MWDIRQYLTPWPALAFALASIVIGTALWRRLADYRRRAASVKRTLESNAGRATMNDLLAAMEPGLAPEDARAVLEETLTGMVSFAQIRVVDDWVALVAYTGSATEAPSFALNERATPLGADSSGAKAGWTLEPELRGPRPREVRWEKFGRPGQGTVLIALLAFLLIFGPVPLLSILLGLAGLVLCVFLVRRVRRERRLLRIGEPTCGRVESIDHTGQVVYATIRYEYRGQPRTLEIDGGSAVNAGPGDLLTLLVDPENPDDIMVYRDRLPLRIVDPAKP